MELRTLRYASHPSTGSGCTQDAEFHNRILYLKTALHRHRPAAVGPANLGGLLTLPGDDPGPGVDLLFNILGRGSLQEGDTVGLAGSLDPLTHGLHFRG